jgi:hypothetical protein
MGGLFESVRGASPLDVARREMRPHERLIWADRPALRARGTPAIGRILFGLAFGGFAVFWTSAAWMMTHRVHDGLFGVFFPLFGVPFIVVGAGMVLGGLRSWLDKGSTVYAISSERVLIISGGARKTVRSLDLKAIRGVERVEGEHGVGTITLLIEGKVREVLAGVPDVARVGAEIERLREETGAATPPPAS